MNRDTVSLILDYYPAVATVALVSREWRAAIDARHYFLRFSNQVPPTSYSVALLEHMVLLTRHYREVKRLHEEVHSPWVHVLMAIDWVLLTLLYYCTTSAPQHLVFLIMSLLYVNYMWYMYVVLHCMRITKHSYLRYIPNSVHFLDRDIPFSCTWYVCCAMTVGALPTMLSASMFVTSVFKDLFAEWFISSVIKAH